MNNKKFKKTYNRAVLTLVQSQKHYVIFGNNVLQENISRKPGSVGHDSQSVSGKFFAQARFHLITEGQT